MTRVKPGRKIFWRERLSRVAVAIFIGLTSAATLFAQTPTLRDALQTDNDGNSKTNAGDRLKYTLIFTNTTGGTLTNLQILFGVITNTTLASNSIVVSPVARDEGPIATSVPGNAFHTAFNAALVVNNGDASQDLLNNDFVGAPASTITKFGGGTLGGSVDDHNAGATASNGGHSLTVNADGSFTYTPAGGFTGSFTFQYRLANVLGSDTAIVTVNVGARPSPVPDARIVTGNVQIDTATGTAFSVLDNDGGDAVTITPNTGGTLGAVVMNANGQFVYTPPRGKSSGTDTFSYTLQNGFGTSTPATVTLNFDGNIVWFINGSAGAGDGRSQAPYNSLAAFNTVNDGGANNPADTNVIVLREGTYANNVVGGALVLRNGQRVIGDGWSGTFLAAAGFSMATHSVVAAFSGTNPVIQNTTGNGIALASGNHLRGVTAGNTPNGFGYSGAAVGSPVIAESSKTGTGGAINITTSGAFGSSVVFDTLESTSSTGPNLSLTNVTGTLGVTSAGAGFAGSAAGSAAVNVSAGSVSLTYPGTVLKANAGSLVNVSGGHTGTLTFNGTMSATAGDGLQFNNADGIYNFNATVTLNGGDAGVDILNGSSGNFSFTDTDITNPSGAAFLVSTSAGGSIGHAGTITKNSAGRAVDITGKTGGSVTFNGAIAQNNAASTGIFLNGNTGGTISFLGAITLTTGNNAAFTATGGGIVIATASGSTLNSGNGTALNVSNTTIGASGLTFQSISSSGGTATGIVLDNTGASGGLTVTGTGGAASGGTIANKTGADGATTTGSGIYLNNTRNVSLTRMQLNDFQNYGIRGNAVTGFRLQNCVINGVNGNNVATPFNDGSVSFIGTPTTGFGLSGQVYFLDNEITGGAQRNVSIDNATGTLHLHFLRNNVHHTGPSFGDDGFAIEVDTSAVLFANVSSNTFTAHGGDHFNLSLINNANADLTFKNNDMQGGHAIGLGQGVFILGATYNGTFKYDISDNGSVADPFVGNKQGAAIFVNKGSGTATYSGQIANNVIGNPAVAGSGSEQAQGIHASARGAGGSHTTLIKGNLVRQYFDRGIVLEAGEGAPTFTVTLTNNTLSDFADAINSLHGIHCDFGILGTDNAQITIDVRNNLIANAGNEPQGGVDFRMRTAGGNDTFVAGYAGGNSSANAQAFIDAANPDGTTFSVSQAASGTYNNGPASPLPVPNLPTLPNP